MDFARIELIEKRRPPLPDASSSTPETQSGPLRALRFSPTGGLLPASLLCLCPLFLLPMRAYHAHAPCSSRAECQAGADVSAGGLARAHAEFDALRHGSRHAVSARAPTPCSAFSAGPRGGRFLPLIFLSGPIGPPRSSINGAKRPMFLQMFSNGKGLLMD